MFDTVIIGGGVVGCSIARYLSRYQLDVCLLDKNSDVCEGTSKANSAIIHAGFDALPGTVKARFNVEGNKMMPALSKELDIEFKQNGALVLCFDENDRPKLNVLYERGIANGVEDLRIIEGDELHRLEAKVSDKAVAALYAPTSGIVCPFSLTIAMAENANVNGVQFMLKTEVTNIVKKDDHYEISTLSTEDGKKDILCARTVVNAAGVYADVIHNMVSARRLHITPRIGEYCLLDKSEGSMVSNTIFQLPGAYGKGILVTPTVHGNLLIGPTAADVKDKDSTVTTAEGLAKVISTSAVSVDNIAYNKVITSFSGVRAHEDGDDFVIGEAEDAEGFFDAAGIESPGLTSAPAIGKYLAAEVAKKLGAKEKSDFIATRRGIPKLAGMNAEDRNALIRENPDYAEIVCRCEQISRGEIIDAIKRPVGATTLDGIKRRTRQGMGRCQSGFCLPKAIAIISQELGIDIADVRKNRPGSEVLHDR